MLAYLIPNNSYAIDNIKGELRFKLGFHFRSRYLTDDLDRYPIPNFLLSSELLLLNKYINFGLGAIYQFLTYIGVEQGKFGFLPLFGVLELNLKPSAKFEPSIVAHMGYNTLYGDENFKDGEYITGASLKGGLYYGFGFHFKDKLFLLEFLFKVNKGSVSKTGAYKDSSTNEMRIFKTETDVYFRYISIMFGININ